MVKPDSSVGFLTHVNSNKKDSTSLNVSGGGENFTNFISDELIPFIEKNYPATKERALVGHSLGGLMVINTLIKHGHLFDKYVAIDPSLSWDNWKSLKEYEQALNDNDFKEKSLFISIANTIPMDTLAAQKDTTETTTHFRAILHFVKALKESKNHKLDWQAKYYPNESHGSVALISEYDAFHFVFRKIPINMELAKLKQFEGRFVHQFQNGEDSFLDVVANENILFIKESWSDHAMQFSPTSDTEFYSFQNKFPVKFTKNREGEISQLVAFGTDVWTKIK